MHEVQLTVDNIQDDTSRQNGFVESVRGHDCPAQKTITPNTTPSMDTTGASKAH